MTEKYIHLFFSKTDAQRILYAVDNAIIDADGELQAALRQIKSDIAIAIEDADHRPDEDPQGPNE